MTAGRLRAGAHQGHGEASRADEDATRRDRQHDRHLRHPVERAGRDDQDGTATLLLVTLRRIERHDIDVAALHVR